MPRYKDFILGYGSLVDREQLRRFLKREEQGPDKWRVCQLPDYRRTWNIAMDNRQTIPGYRYYIDSGSGMRPAVYVAFLNVRPACGEQTTGLLFGVSADELAMIDQRERNYQRIDITALLAPTLPDIEGCFWLYCGLPEAEQRFQAGKSSGSTVIARSYFETVASAYATLGPAHADNYSATTDNPQVPLRDLITVLC
jgi:dephospho-CoA kinase